VSTGNLIDRATEIAVAFHHERERLEPRFGDDPKPWSDLNDKDRALLIVPFSNLIRRGVIR
jgi:hypothetical protein